MLYENRWLRLVNAIAHRKQSTSDKTIFLWHLRGIAHIFALDPASISHRRKREATEHRDLHEQHAHEDVKALDVAACDCRSCEKPEVCKPKSDIRLVRVCEAHYDVGA